MSPPQDTRRDVDVMTVEWPQTAVGRSGTGLAHVELLKKRYSTEEVLDPAFPPRTRRWSAVKIEKILTIRISYPHPSTEPTNTNSKYK